MQSYATAILCVTRIIRTFQMKWCCKSDVPTYAKIFSNFVVKIEMSFVIILILRQFPEVKCSLCKTRTYSNIITCDYRDVCGVLNWYCNNYDGTTMMIRFLSRYLEKLAVLWFSESYVVPWEEVRVHILFAS